MSREEPVKFTPETVPEMAKKWANDLHRDMIAATLLDPSLICFRSVATDEPESVVRAKLMNELIASFTPKQVPDLERFLPNLVGNSVK